METVFLDIRRKVIGDARSPWYIRWWWAIVLAVLFIAVAIAWYVSAKKEARLKAKGRTAEELAKQAQLKAENAADEEEAQRLHEEAVEASNKAAQIRKDLDEAARKRKSITAAIKGADSWEELERLENEIN